jgi:hypothetical protein
MGAGSVRSLTPLLWRGALLVLVLSLTGQSGERIPLTPGMSPNSLSTYRGNDGLDF